MISLTSSGSFDRTEAYLRRLTDGQIYKSLRVQAEKGRAALADATPRDTSRAAQSWSATVRKRGSMWEIVWSNSDEENGFPVAIALQYGYSTGTGGYVRGRDYINPAIQPIFDEIATTVWREVTRA